MFETVLHDTNPLWLIGVASAVLSLYAYLPYAIDTIAGRTQPQRASWMLWSILGSIALGSQIYEGASQSLWFAGIQVGGTILIFLLAISRGSGRFLQPGDGYALSVAAFGLVLWCLTDSSVFALAISISISAIGGSVTVKKAYRDPSTETLSTWACSFVAAGLAVISVGMFDLVLLAYPIYLFVLNGAILLAMFQGRRRKVRYTMVPAE